MSLPASLAIPALLLAACASPPPAPSREGEEELEIAALSWAAKADLFTPPGLLRVPERLEGVRCTFSNDKGTWTVVAPGRVKVQRSAAPLRVECVGPGFAVFRETRPCISERERLHRQQQVEMPLDVLLVPLAIVALPVAPQITAQAAGQFALRSGSLAAADAAAKSKPDVCSYGNITPAMTRP